MFAGVGGTTGDGGSAGSVAPGSAGFRVIQSLIACAGLLLAPDSLYAQVLPNPIPAINPLIDSLGLPPATVQELTTLCPPALPNPKVVPQR